MQNEDKASAFSAADIRFTARGAALYAAIMDWPTAPVTIASLAGAKVGRVTLLGQGPLDFRQTGGGLRLTLPAAAAGAFVPVLRIEGDGIA